MKLRLRNYDFVGRNGGEEFYVVLPSTPIATAHAVVERLRITVAGHRFTYETKDFSVKVSIGASSLERMHSSDLTLMLKQADEALYKAKMHDRNQTVLC